MASICKSKEVYVITFSFLLPLSVFCIFWKGLQHSLGKISRIEALLWIILIILILAYFPKFFRYLERKSEWIKRFLSKRNISAETIYFISVLIFIFLLIYYFAVFVFSESDNETLVDEYLAKSLIKSQIHEITLKNQTLLFFYNPFTTFQCCIDIYNVKTNEIVNVTCIKPRESVKLILGRNLGFNITCGGVVVKYTEISSKK